MPKSRLSQKKKLPLSQRLTKNGKMFAGPGKYLDGWTKSQ